MDCENCIDCENECNGPKSPGFHTEATRDNIDGSSIEYPRTKDVGFEFDILVFSDGWKYISSYSSVTEGHGRTAVEALKNIQHTKEWRVVNAFTGLIIERKRKKKAFL